MNLLIYCKKESIETDKSMGIPTEKHEIALAELKKEKCQCECE
jgi:hypothetical protein